ERFEVLGLAQGQVHQFAATCDGRLKDVPVQLFEKVGRGQTLAVIDTVLDDENLQAQLDTASAEIQHLKAGLVSTEDQLLTEAVNRQTDWVGAQRRFSVDVENARVAVLELKALLEADRMTLQELELDNKTFLIQRLSDQNDTMFFELQQIRARYNTLASQIEENERLLEQAGQDLREAQQRRDEFAQRRPQDPSVDSALEIIREAVKVQEKRIEELLARRVPLVLESPFDGVVSQIIRGPGEAVLAGDPILAVAEARPSEIIAYAGADQLGRVQERLAVELIKTTEPAQVAASQVVYLGANIELMPQKLWQNPNIPEWGRPVLIKIPPGLELVPGEVVGIRGL
ncbi:MAG: HlyD family efflux transporter periplasmic adaptor subunit, partial [Planctomycetota bacterium]